MKTEMIELYKWGESVFGRIGLDLSEVVETPREWSVRLRVKNMEDKFAISMASIDKNLNLTDEEHKIMHTFLEALI